MLEPRRITSENKPSITINLGTGYWYYNYDITSTTVEVPNIEDNSTVEKTVYSYIQVRVPAIPTYKKCVELVIREYLTQSQEFDLINSANKAILAGQTSGDEITEYQEYLSKVEEIKEKVAKDLGK